VVAGLEEDRSQQCVWRRSRQLERRGIVSDRPEERSMAPVDGSAGNTVVGLGCGVTELRGAAVDSVATVRGCVDSGMKKGGELRCMASEGDTAGCMLGTWRQQRHAAPASEARWRSRDSVVGTALAQCAFTRRAVERRRGCLKPTGLVLWHWAGPNSVHSVIFPIIETLLRFQNTK
jgi:hypothetical protein